VTSVVPIGKKILVVDNGAYGTRMASIARTYKIDVVDYKIPYGDFPDLNKIMQLLQSDKDISHIGMIHHETTTGMLNPVKEVSEIAHQYGVEMIVDTISSYAGMPINIKEYNLEFITSTSNKCIQGMPGLAFVIAKKEALKKLEPNRRSFYLDLLSQHIYFEKTKQTQFTPPVQVIYALRKAIDEYFIETEKGRSQRYYENWKLIYEGVIHIGFKPLLPLHQESKILTAFCEPSDTNYSFEQMHDYLFERGFTIYPGKGAKNDTFRLSILGDLYKDDIINFLKVLEEYVEVNGIKF
jgi:2-aminoethylphosphonate aminotransferase